MKRGAVIFLQAMAVSVALAGGYLAGTRSFFQSGWVSGSMEWESSGGSGDWNSESGGAKKTSGEAALSWDERKTMLFKRWKSSPCTSGDFELQEESRQFLDRVPVPDLEAWIRELPSTSNDETDIRPYLRRFILEALAPRAGGYLVKSLAVHPPNQGDMDDARAALRSWLQSDPAAALAWMERGEVPASLKDEIEGARADARTSLDWKDPEAFEKRLAGLNEEDRLEALASFACEASFDPEKREVVLRRISTASPEDAKALRGPLLRTMGQENWRLAVGTMVSLPMPDEERADIDLSLTTEAAKIGQFFGPRPEQAEIMQGWLDRNPGEALPEKYLEVTEGWSSRDEEGYRSWLERQPAGKRRDILAAQLIRGNLANGNPSELEERVGLIQDEALRAEVRQQVETARLEKEAREAKEQSETEARRREVSGPSE